KGESNLKIDGCNVLSSFNNLQPIIPISLSNRLDNSSNPFSIKYVSGFKNRIFDPVAFLYPKSFALEKPRFFFSANTFTTPRLLYSYNAFTVPSLESLSTTIISMFVSYFKMESIQRITSFLLFQVTIIIDIFVDSF